MKGSMQTNFHVVMCSLNMVIISFKISSYLWSWQALCYLAVIVEVKNILALHIDQIYPVEKGICDKSFQKCCSELAWYMCMASLKWGTLWRSLRHYDMAVCTENPDLWLCGLQYFKDGCTDVCIMHYWWSKEWPSLHYGLSLCVFSSLLCYCMDKWFVFLSVTYWIGIHLCFDDNMTMESSGLHQFIW